MSDKPSLVTNEGLYLNDVIETLRYLGFSEKDIKNTVSMMLTGTIICESNS
jgi:Holliday junction resolvasome RuvABC DNA-binding subunit